MLTAAPGQAAKVGIEPHITGRGFIHIQANRLAHRCQGTALARLASLLRLPAPLEGSIACRILNAAARLWCAFHLLKRLLCPGRDDSPRVSPLAKGALIQAHKKKPIAMSNGPAARAARRQRK
jgi:hypothetical protein